MRRLSSVLGLAALLAALLALTPLGASAHDTKRVVISERMQFVPPNMQSGTFVATGAINDAGSAAATFTLAPTANDRQLLEGAHVLTGSGGTITIETRAYVHDSSPPSPPRSHAVGHWWISAATGSYAGLAGRGEVIATADFTTGEITILRDGHVTER
jgi:hypothetical protein